MELQDLVGQHVLDAVDFTNEDIPDGLGGTDGSQVCRFRLDGVVYAAIEDPSDGYRSSMRGIVVVEDAKLTKAFPMVRVIGIYQESYSEDVLRLFDVETGKSVLEVGTLNTDDYYPSFVASFSPENMTINAR